MTINSIAQSQMQSNFQKLSTGFQINSAKDNPANMAISEKILAEVKGLEQGMRNTEYMNDLVNTAEGGLSTVSASLDRVRELTLQASNGILNDSDRQLIQNEIGEILDGIDDQVSNVQYNGQNLLDGSFTDKNTASYSDGTGQQISIPSVSVEGLGLSGFDVTKNPDLKALDSALATVSSARANLGAVSNRLGHTYTSNAVTSLNLAASRSKLVDTDMAKVSSDVEKSKLLEEYQAKMQKKKQEEEKNKVSVFF